MIHRDFNSAFREMHRQLGRVRTTLPTAIANEGTRFFVNSFQQEGFTDISTQKWKTPLRRIPGTPEYKYPKKRDKGRRTRKTLVKSGALRRSVNNSLRTKSFSMIVWQTDLPYAKYHNNGSGKIPKRQFMGESHFLNRKFKEKIIQAYRKTFGSAVS